MRHIYAIVACLALYFGAIILLVVLIAPAHGIELSIMGHSSGQGMQNMSFAGDLINVSILQNSSWQGWNVSLGGHA